MYLKLTPTNKNGKISSLWQKLILITHLSILLGFVFIEIFKLIRK